MPFFLNFRAFARRKDPEDHRDTPCLSHLSRRRPISSHPVRVYKFQILACISPFLYVTIQRCDTRPGVKRGEERPPNKTHTFVHKVHSLIWNAPTEMRAIVKRSYRTRSFPKLAKKNTHTHRKNIIFSSIENVNPSRSFVILLSTTISHFAYYFDTL